jgi:hypothetical protein
MSNSFTNQVLAQLELWKHHDKYENKCTLLPKHLDEKVARLHLAKIGVELEELTPDQAEYIGVTSGRALQARILPLLSTETAAPARCKVKFFRTPPSGGVFYGAFRPVKISLTLCQDK